MSSTRGISGGGLFVPGNFMFMNSVRFGIGKSFSDRSEINNISYISSSSHIKKKCHEV